MPKMRAVQIPGPKAPFQMVERDIQDPQPGFVRIRVQACGVCHSDLLAKEGHWPGVQYPRVPGYEVAGVIDAIGAGVAGWQTGQRVGVGWYGGHCGYCDSCRRGKFVLCLNARKITGLDFDGGYQDYMIAPAATLAAIPDGVSAVDAAPLMCAGVTTFNSLRNAGAQSGDTVGILGVGGLGHLGVQFAAKMGFRTVAIARGADKESFAKSLGAHHYIDSQAGNSAEALTKLGGAKVILATVTDAKAMTAVIEGLSIDGKLVVLGAPSDPLQISAFPLIGGHRSVVGWPSGSSIDSQDTMSFCTLTGIKPMTETFPLERAEDAYARMMSGKARFRAVITTGA